MLQDIATPTPPASNPAQIAAQIAAQLSAHTPAQTPARTTADLRQPFAAAHADFVARARQLVPRGEAGFGSCLPAGRQGPLHLEAVQPGFAYWETLGYQIPLLERMFMGSNASPQLVWDGELFSALAALPFADFPMSAFKLLCPYREAFPQMAILRPYMRGRKILIVGSQSYWLELFCAIGGAAEITTVEYREITWTTPPVCQARLQTLRWDAYIADLGRHLGVYDLVLSYSSIEHSGLGRYGDPVTPLGDLLTFLLMSRCMKPTGMSAHAVPVGQDLTHFNAHRIYGQRRIRALEQIGAQRFLGIVSPGAADLVDDEVDELKSGWSLAKLARLPLGDYRQPMLCFGGNDFSTERY